MVTLLLWLYLTSAAIFIGGEINSEIEKAATKAGHRDVRRPEERRSGGTGWNTGVRESRLFARRKLSLAELIQFQIWQPEGWSKSLKKT